MWGAGVTSVFLKLERGYIRQNHPFMKPPLLSPSEPSGDALDMSGCTRSFMSWLDAGPCEGIMRSDSDLTYLSAVRPSFANDQQWSTIRLNVHLPEKYYISYSRNIPCRNMHYMLGNSGLQNLFVFSLSLSLYISLPLSLALSFFLKSHIDRLS